MIGLRTAIAMFTILPVPRAWHRNTAREDATAALTWLPFVGAALGCLAGLAAAAVLAHDRAATFLSGALALAVLVVLSRALHVDGLADTADGLGSGTPPQQALEIMRRSDIGPFGVTTVLLVLVVDVAALTTIAAAGIWRPLAALAVAGATGRLAALHTALPGLAAARPGGFGAMVATRARYPATIAITVAVLGGGAGVAAALGANPLGWPVAQAIALLLTGLFGRHAGRRLAGVTGDVFGALIELATALTLVGLALLR